MLPAGAQHDRCLHRRTEWPVEWRCVSRSQCGLFAWHHLLIDSRPSAWLTPTVDARRFKYKVADSTRRGLIKGNGIAHRLFSKQHCSFSHRQLNAIVNISFALSLETRREVKRSRTSPSFDDPVDERLSLFRFRCFTHISYDEPPRPDTQGAITRRLGTAAGTKSDAFPVRWLTTKCF